MQEFYENKIQINLIMLNFKDINQSISTKFYKNSNFSNLLIHVIYTYKSH